VTGPCNVDQGAGIGDKASPAIRSKELTIAEKFASPLRGEATDALSAPCSFGA
jgi:hypothetical protein